MTIRQVKEKVQFVCRECGYQSGKWLGRCTGCGSWESMEEQRVSSGKKALPQDFARPQPLTAAAERDSERVTTGITELDRVLGGGVVPGSVTLLGGEPGIGKSTILLQLLAQWTGPALYVTAEESAQQVRLRAERLETEGYATIR